jgi:hypothetical protein
MMPLRELGPIVIINETADERIASLRAHDRSSLGRAIQFRKNHQHMVEKGHPGCLNHSLHLMDRGFVYDRLEMLVTPIKGVGFRFGRQPLWLRAEYLKDVVSKPDVSEPIMQTVESFYRSVQPVAINGS